VRGVAYGRARSTPAGARSKSTCCGSPKTKTMWRPGNGVALAAATAAIAADPPPAERPPSKARSNGSNGALTDSRSHGAVVTDRPIVVIDRRVLARDCLVRCLRDAIEGRTILAFDTVAEWLAVADGHLQPSVVLICVTRYKGADQQATDDFVLLKASSDVPCIVLSDAEDCNQAVSAIEDGAQGFIPATVSLDVAVQAVRLVEAGGTFIPASVLILSQRARETREENGHAVASLFTVRQAAVLAALHQGRSNKQIAYQLQMSEGTVKVHVREIMKKVHARNRTEVVLRTPHDQSA
jgi:DNA-binding NarL/FixJ family response regulator